MAICSQCGRECSDEFAFCPACGAALAGMARPREVRKTVSILFCDLTGSTAIGERTDPEALRRLMNRYYETARGVLERHGGTVEKFVGDAVMAVFGIPVSTELDALRAVRAAVELRDVVQGLGLEVRIGVNTGAVVAGEGDTLVTGDAVNVAARLEQAAGAGEILLGDDTLQLVRDAVSAAPVELSLKGKSSVVAAHRLLGLDPAATGVARHLERPMIGRERERGRLRADFEDVVAGPTCRLFTLIGPAGIGKSRLVADFLEHLDGTAEVARGRALSYGEGITYWPLVEMLIQLGIEPSDAIRSSPAETQLATRALLERRAAERPLVLVIDDLQWGEAPMLDLVEHIADWSRAAPILLLCVARPELLDERPGWAGGKLNATSILLEPLADPEATRLADDLLDGIELDSETRLRILSTAEGNPLFLEEMAALARDARGAVDVPPTIRALLQARLDTLNDGERTVIQRGAVEGQVFHRGSVTALAPATPIVDVTQQLVALVRKELVRPDEALIAGDTAFRFRHLLIRDAAYEGLPKAVRAELHERFADWLEAHAELVEQDEIVGYHLEQAACYRLELDPEDDGAAEVGRRAAACLAAAGHAAFEREDYHATCSLLQRAADLLQGAARRGVIPELVYALFEVRGEGVAEYLAELEQGDERDVAVATALRIICDPTSASPNELLDRLEVARSTLENVGAPLDIAICESARAITLWVACQMGESYRALCQARDVLRGSGRAALQRRLLTETMIAAVFGGMAVDELRRLIDTLAAEVDDTGPLLSATLAGMRARVDYHAGLIDRDTLVSGTEEEIELLRQTGSRESAYSVERFRRTFVAWCERDLEALEREERRSCEEVERLDLDVYLANQLANWAVALCAIGDAATALEAVDRGRRLAKKDDVADQTMLDAGEGFARALRGEREASQELFERVHTRTETMDMAYLTDYLEHVECMALAASGSLDEARTRLSSLAERADTLGQRRWADRCRADIAALAAPP